MSLASAIKLLLTLHVLGALVFGFVMFRTRNACHYCDGREKVLQRDAGGTLHVVRCPHCRYRG